MPMVHMIIFQAVRFSHLFISSSIVKFIFKSAYAVLIFVFMLRQFLILKFARIIYVFVS
jgi:hypothetical protein